MMYISLIILVAFACLGCVLVLEKAHDFLDNRIDGWIMRSLIVAIPAIIAVCYIVAF